MYTLFFANVGYRSLFKISIRVPSPDTCVGFLRCPLYSRHLLPVFKTWAAELARDLRSCGDFFLRRGGCAHLSGVATHVYVCSHVATP